MTVFDSLISFAFVNDSCHCIRSYRHLAKTHQKTITDANGRFSISLPEGTRTDLQFSYIGMKPQTVSVNAKGELKPLRIVLQEDAGSLGEVVVTGVITKRKETFTGSSATFSGDELKSVGVQNPIQSLRSLDPSFNLWTTASLALTLTVFRTSKSVESRACSVCATNCLKTPTNLFSYLMVSSRRSKLFIILTLTV